MEKSIEIFFCYAREDEVLRQGLEKHLRAYAARVLLTYGTTAKLALAQNGSMKSIYTSKQPASSSYSSVPTS
ncbi:MAG: hypothetical protein ACR2H5_07040 [Ktedonobacteraceae bacterium]